MSNPPETPDTRQGYGDALRSLYASIGALGDVDESDRSGEHTAIVDALVAQVPKLKAIAEAGLLDALKSGDASALRTLTGITHRGGRGRRKAS